MGFVRVGGRFGAVGVGDVEVRDRLIADQEALLNVYRCMFDVDVHVVPGGCVNGAPSSPAKDPAPFSGDLTAQDIAVRDNLIANQETLLNVYRCRFRIDMQQVPGGCPEPVEPPPTAVVEPEPTAVVVVPEPVDLICPANWAEVDTDGDGQDDTCEPPPGHDEEAVTPPLYPWGAWQLGCVLTEVPLCSQSPPDMLPTADRVPTPAELRAISASPEGAEWIPPRVPSRHGDALSLSVVTSCLRSFPNYALPDPADPDLWYDGPPVARCWAVWMHAEYAVDYLGGDPQCVWEAVERVFLHGGLGGWEITPYSVWTGWAETCSSVLDMGRPELAWDSRCNEMGRAMAPMLTPAIAAQCAQNPDWRSRWEAYWDDYGRCGELWALTQVGRTIAQIEAAQEPPRAIARPDLLFPDIPDDTLAIC